MRTKQTKRPTVGAIARPRELSLLRGWYGEGEALAYVLALDPTSEKAVAETDELAMEPVFSGLATPQRAARHALANITLRSRIPKG